MQLRCIYHAPLLYAIRINTTKKHLATTILIGPDLSYFIDMGFMYMLH